MRSFRYLLLLLLLAGLGVFGWRSGARLHLRPTARTPLAWMDFPDGPDDSAVAGLLDRSLKSIRPEVVQWLETDLWQRVNLPDLCYEAEGKLLLAPADRFRLELTTRTPGTAGPGRHRCELLVSDGTNLWSARRGPKGDWIEQPLPEGFAPRSSRTAPARTPPDRGRSGLLPGRGGPAALLAQLRARLKWVRSETLADGRTCLTGLVRPEDGDAGLSTTIRACRVVLDAHSLWPGRIEWWGPVSGPAVAKKRDALLIEMEFRNPVLDHPLPLERCVREFTLRPAATVVTVPTSADRSLSIPAPPR
jgi:hypothetical protein